MVPFYGVFVRFFNKGTFLLPEKLRILFPLSFVSVVFFNRVFLPFLCMIASAISRGAEEKKNESDVYLADDKSGR
jgi:hypothetical protein